MRVLSKQLLHQPTAPSKLATPPLTETPFPTPPWCQATRTSRYLLSGTVQHQEKKPSPALGKRHNSFELSWPGWRDVPGSEDSPRSDSLAPLFPCKREKVSRLARGLCLLVSPEDWVRGRNKVIITALVVLYTFDIKSPK